LNRGTTKPTILILLIVSFSTVSGEENLIRIADNLFDRRAEGSTSRRALIDPANNSLKAYNHAITIYPDTISLHWKRLRAFHFLIEFADLTDSSQTELIDSAKSAADSAMLKIEAVCFKNPRSSKKNTINTLNCLSSDVASTYFWSAICIGIWSRSQEGLATKLKSTKRIFNYAEQALAIDPTVDRGGSQRLLSVLHGTIPKVPFITGFIDKQKALTLVDDALALYPNHPGNRLLKATAMMNHAYLQSDSSQIILKSILSETPHGPWRVEWHKVLAMANKLLNKRDNATK
jgi:hypothetical protein